jgi:hypothetical protein
MRPWQVLLIVFGTLAVLAFGGCAALLATIHIDLSHLNLGFGPRATQQELAAAATTVPVTHSDCATFQRVGDAGTTVGKVNFGPSGFEAGAAFAAYRDRLSRVLITYDVDLRAAIAVAHGPLRSHLVAAEHSVLAGLTQLRNAQTSRQYDSFMQASNGYMELVIAQQLLLGHCGRGVEPNIDKALPGFPPLNPTTTAVTTSTTVAAS